MLARNRLGEKLWATGVWAVVIFFIVNLVALIAAVVVNSFGTRWLGTWLPSGLTGHWYGDAWDEFQLNDVLLVTAEVVVAVVALSGVLGVPAAYCLARREFPGKKLVLLCRSGVRSHHAAALAAQNGYGQAFNVLEGFEGDKNASGQRRVNGW